MSEKTGQEAEPGQIRVVIENPGPDHYPVPAAARPVYLPGTRVPPSQARRRTEAQRALQVTVSALGELRDDDLTPELLTLIGDAVAVAEDILSRHDR